MIGLVFNDGGFDLANLDAAQPDLRRIDRTGSPKVVAAAIGGPANNPRLIVADEGGNIELWDPSDGGLNNGPLDRELLSAYLENQNIVRAAMDSDGQRFALVGDGGRIVVGRIANDALQVVGFMPTGISSSFSLNVVFDDLHDRVVALIDDCLVALDWQSAVKLGDTPPPEWGDLSGCSSDRAQTVNPYWPFSATALLPGGDILTTIARDANSSGSEALYFIDARPPDASGNSGSRASTLLKVGFSADGSGLIDSDPRSGWLVRTRDGHAEFVELAKPTRGLECDGECNIVASLGPDRLIVKSKGDTSAEDRLFLAEFDPQNIPRFQELPTGDLRDFIGSSLDGNTIVVSDPKRCEFGTIDLRDPKPPEQKTALAGVECTNAASASSGVASGEGSSRSLPNTSAGAATSWITKVDTKAGTIFEFRKEGWPAFFFSASSGIAAASPKSQLLAWVSDTGIKLEDRADQSDFLISGASPQKVVALAFSPDGTVLYALDLLGWVWHVGPKTPGAQDWKRLESQVARLDLRPQTTEAANDRGPGSGVTMQISADKITIASGGRIQRLARDGTARSDTISPGTTFTWAGETDDGVATVGPEIWVWQSSLKDHSPEADAVAVATASTTKISLDDLRQSYVLPEPLERSLSARLGSEACAKDIASRGMGATIRGCPDAVAKTPTDGAVLVADALALLTAKDTAAAVPSDTSSAGSVDSGADQSAGFDRSAEDAHLILIAAAAGGDLTALSLLADELSPARAEFRNSSLLPASGWAGTIGVLEQLKGGGAPLPVALLDLVNSLSADPAVTAARDAWLERLAKAGPDADPTAMLARALVMEGQGASVEESLKTYANLIPRLTRVSDDASADLAKRRFAALAKSVTPKQALALLQAGRQAASAASSNAGEGQRTPLTLDPAVQRYLAALGSPEEARPLRPAAVEAVIASLPRLVSNSAFSGLASHYALKQLLAALQAGSAPQNLDKLLSDLILPSTVDRGVEFDLVKSLFEQLRGLPLDDLPSSDWRLRVEPALFVQAAKLADSAGDTSNRAIAAAALNVLANHASSSDADAQMAELRQFMIENFDSALDWFSSADDAARKDANQFALKLAEAAGPSDDSQSVATLAAQAILGAEGQGDGIGVLREAAKLIKTRDLTGVDGWVLDHWASLLPVFFDTAQPLKDSPKDENYSRNLEDAVSLLTTGLQLDARLSLLAGDSSVEHTKSPPRLQSAWPPA